MTNPFLSLIVDKAAETSQTSEKKHVWINVPSRSL